MTRVKRRASLAPQKVRVHRWRQRAPGSRYWDCINPGCTDFYCDVRVPARKRAVPHFIGLNHPCPTGKLKLRPHYRAHFVPGRRARR